MNSDGKSAAERYACFVIKYRWAVISFIFAWTILAALFIKDVNLRNDPDSLLPLSNRYIATNLYNELHYGMGNIMVWGVKVKQGDIFQPWFVKMLDAFYDDVIKLDYANAENFAGLPSSRMRHLGLSEEGNLDFKRLIPASGFSAESKTLDHQIDFLKNGLQTHPVLEPLLVYYENDDAEKCDLLDENGVLSNQSVAYAHEQCSAKATFIVGDFNNELKDDYINWINAVNKLQADYELRYGDRVEFLISGEPYFLASMVQEVWDKAWLFGVSLLIILLVLWYEYRTWSCSVFPLLGVGMTIILTLGLMGFTEFKLTTMMVLTPMLLLAIGIGHAMQVTRRFKQEYQKSDDPEVAAYKAIRFTIVPATLSIGTDLHGFFAISFVDISFYKAYAYFGIFGMSTLILTTTTLIPLLLMIFPPENKSHREERGWENKLGKSIANLLTSKLKWIPLAMVFGILWLSADYAELGRGVDAVFAGEAGRSDPEVARIQDEFDIMPGIEKGINYPRAAFKDHYMLGEIVGAGEVRQISDLDKLSAMMPGAITANMIIRSKLGTLPLCGEDSRNDYGDRVIGPEQCYDELDDPAQGIFNDATVLKALSDFEDWLRKHPYVGYSTSYIQFVKTLNMMLNSPDGVAPMKHMNLFAIPVRQHLLENRYAYADPDDPDYLPVPDDTVQLYNAMLVNSSGPGELDSFVNTTTWDEGIIVSFINTMDPVLTHQTIVDIQNYLHEHQNEPGFRKIRVGITAGEKVEIRIDNGVKTIVTEESIQDGKVAIGGFLGITEATRDVAFAEWLHAPAMTSLTVFLMSAIMFRSWSIAFVLICLCYITLMSQYGLAGYMTSIKEWSANLAFHVQVALSIAMGLGIDYGIYMVSRLREEMQRSKLNWYQALEKTLSSTGSAIVISVVVLLGSVIPLMNTTLANTWSVSLYIAEALILDVLTALMFLPIIIYWLKPRFVFSADK
ncbi:MAG: MMPL family transporter [Gammaproteobacteria bacterium]|nr:MMPL family transporter [Gammaproteobacteria bacterium]